VAGKNDFVLRLGFKIDAKSISKTALRAALNSAASGVVLKISKVQLANPAKIRKDISTQIGTIQIKNLSVSAQASKAFSQSINNKVRPVIKGLTVSPASLANLRKSVERALRNVSVRTSPAGGGGGGGGDGGGGGASAARASANTQVARTTEQVAAAAKKMKFEVLEANRVQQQSVRIMTAQQKAALRLTQTLRQSGLSFNEVGSRVAQVTKRFAEYTLSVKGLQAAQAVVRTAVKGVKDLDNATRDLAKVGSVGPDISRSFNAISKTALVTGKTVADAGVAIGEFVRQGKDLATAAKFAQKALQLTNISNLDAASSARLVTAAQQVFGVTTEDLGAKLSSLAVFADSSATSVTEVGTAFLRTASSAASAGLTIEETFAILASTLEQTRLNASTVGTAFKTIFARLGRDRQKVSDLAESFGLVIDSGLPIIEFLRKLSPGFKKLNSDQKNLVALQVAGVRQANVFIAALENLDKSQELLNNTQEDAAELTRKNAEELKKLSVRAKQVGVALQTAAGALAGLESGDQGGVAGIFGTTLDGIKSAILLFPQLISELNKIEAEGFKLGNVLSSSLVGALAGALGSVIPAMINGFRQMTTSAAATATATVGVNGALKQGATLAKQRLDLNRQNLEVVNQTTQAHRRETGSSLRRSTSAAGVRNSRSGLSRGRDPSGRAVLGGAALGIAAFAAADAVQQFTDKIADTEGLDSARKAQIEFAGAATSQALSLGAIGKARGALIGVILAAGASIAQSIQDFREAVKKGLSDGLTGEIAGTFNNKNLDLRDASNEAEQLVREVNEVLKDKLKAIEIGNDFRSAIQEVTSGIRSGLHAATLELSGLSPALSSVIAEIESIKSKGDFVSTTVVPEGLTGSAAQIQGKGLFGDDAIQSLISGEASTFDVINDEIKKAQNFADDSRLRVEELSSASITAQGEVNAISAALTKVIDKAKLSPSSNILDIIKKLQKAEDASTSLGSATRAALLDLRDLLNEERPDGSTSLRGPSTKGPSGTSPTRESQGVSLDPSEVLQSIESAVSQIKSKAEESLAGLDAELSKSGETNAKLQTIADKKRKEAVDRTLALAAAQADYNEQLATAVELSKNLLAGISKETQISKSAIDSELRIIELKKGTLAQQIEAVVLAEKLTLESNANLQVIDQQIEALTKLGGAASAVDLKALQGIRAQAVSSLDQRAQKEAQPEIEKLVEADAAKRAAEAAKKVEEARAVAIGKVDAANERVKESDLKRAEASKRLAAANKKVLDAQRTLSSASKGVTDAMLNIAAAQKNLSDVMTRSFATVRSSIRSALSSAGFEKIGSIVTGLGAVLSLEQRLSVIRKEGLEESLRIAQKQAGTLLTIGERIATGGPGARLDAIRGLSTGQAIQDGASVSDFTPEDIKLALQTADLFPGLREDIQTQALATVGLDDELRQARQSVAQDAGSLAREETEKAIENAERQLSAQLAQLVKAKEIERIAQDDLDLAKIAQGQREGELAIANVQAGLANQNLQEAARQTSGILSLRSALLNASKSGSSNTANAARGTLSSSELRGLESAALREKSQMPAGSKLMLANTSETVLTRRQSKRMGISPRRQSNAAGGNGDVSGLSVLLSQVVSRLDQLNASVRTGGVNNVNLQVDTNKNINVRGITGLGGKLESELRNKFASGKDVDAIESAIINIISKLGEAGLADDLGR
jgi:TP901 family phage tail tape measure protein